MSNDYCRDLLETIEFLYKENESLKEKLAIQSNSKIISVPRISVPRIATFQEYCSQNRAAIEISIRQLQLGEKMSEEQLQGLIDDYVRGRWNLYARETLYLKGELNDSRCCFDE